MYKRILVPGLLALGLLCAACGDRSADDVSGVETAHDHAAHDTDVAEGVGHDDHAGHDHAAHADAGISSDEGHDAHDDHAGHDHGAEEGSDLDRPLEELFAAECEHAIKTWQCDECRYEVGVVRAPEELFEQGLLKMATVESLPVRTSPKKMARAISACSPCGLACRTPAPAAACWPKPSAWFATIGSCR